MKVELTYFKKSGKYYTTGEYETDKDYLHEIFIEVRQMMCDGDCPGLNGAGEFTVLIDVPEHVYNHPALVMWPYQKPVKYVKLMSYE